MGKINGCLKCLFIFFNVLFSIFGCFLIYSMMNASVYSHQLSAVGSSGLVWSWVFSIGVLGISCLGISAASSEKEIALKIFAGFMAAGMIIMLIFGFVAVVQRNQIRNEYTKSSMEDEDTRMLVEQLFQMAMGIYFGFSVIALLGLLISLFMIHQIRRPDSTGESSMAMHVY